MIEQDGDPNNVHVVPVNDLVAHDTDGGDCVCIPEVTPVERADGSMGFLHTHHSLDGRELAEPEGVASLETVEAAIKGLREREAARASDEAK